MIDFPPENKRLAATPSSKRTRGRRPVELPPPQAERAEPPKSQPVAVVPIGNISTEDASVRLIDG